MPRTTTNPISTPNQSLNGNILSPTRAAELKLSGRNTSNRPWKLRPQKRASSLVTSNKINGRSKSWEAKEEERRLKRQVKEAQKEMIEEKKRLIREKKERRLENEKRRMENEYENAKRSMQTLNVERVGKTMKAMNKKQLRQIKKTRMNTKTGVVEFVGAYAK